MKNRVYFGWLLTAVGLIFSIAANAQFDDLYYNPDKDQPYHETEYNSSNPNNYEYEDEYDYDDEEFGYYDDYDYYYASRIRRFHNPGYMFDFYDPYYTEMYYYDPFSYGGYYSPGVSIYLSFGNPYRPWRYYHRYNHYYSFYSYNYYNTWCNPWFYNSWYDPWYGGYNNWYYPSYYNYNYYNNYYGGWYGGYYGHHPYGYGGYYGYNNYYNNGGYYGGNNNNSGKHFGSRYGGSTVSSGRGGVRDGGLTNNPGNGTDAGVRKTDIPSSPRTIGETDAGRRSGDFKGDRELNPDRGSGRPIITGKEADGTRGNSANPGTGTNPEREDTRTRISKETDTWKPFGNPGSRNNPGVNEGSRSGATRSSEGVKSEEPSRQRDFGRTRENSSNNDANRGSYNPSVRERTPATNSSPSDSRRSSEGRSYTPSSGSDRSSEGNRSYTPSSGSTRSSESRSYTPSSGSGRSESRSYTPSSSGSSRSSESRSYTPSSSGSSSSSRSSSSMSSGSSSSRSSSSMSSGSSSSGSSSSRGSSSSSSSGSTRSSGR